jgi:hypothetical protein
VQREAALDTLASDDAKSKAVIVADKITKSFGERAIVKVFFKRGDRSPELAKRLVLAREQLAAAVHLIVQQSRLSDGTRKITAISEIVGLERDTGEIETRKIFEFVRTGTGEGGKVIGEFRATGYLPSFLNDFIVMGLVKRGERYL